MHRPCPRGASLLGLIRDGKKRRIVYTISPTVAGGSWRLASTLRVALATVEAAARLPACPQLPGMLLPALVNLVGADSACGPARHHPPPTPGRARRLVRYPVRIVGLPRAAAHRGNCSGPGTLRETFRCMSHPSRRRRPADPPFRAPGTGRLRARVKRSTIRAYRVRMSTCT